MPLTEVAQYVAQASATRAQQQVTSVEVEVPAEILRLGFEFVDTPGVGSAIETSTATTRRFLPQADAIIFVTGFDSPLTEAEAAFLADAAPAGRPYPALGWSRISLGKSGRQCALRRGKPDLCSY